MLESAAGIVQVPEVFDLRENKVKSGYYLQFWIVSLKQGRDSETEYHKYRANMWIPEKDLEKWRGYIKTGRKFKLTNAGWRAKCEEGKEYPLNVCDVDARHLIPLKM